MYSVDQLQKLIEKEIAGRSDEMLKNSPVELYQPIQYSLEMGGKRLRPVLVLLACNMFSDEVEQALPAAVAVEVFHNFTLLHDDIMDKAAVRITSYNVCYTKLLRSSIETSFPSRPVKAEATKKGCERKRCTRRAR